MKIRSIVFHESRMDGKGRSLFKAKRNWKLNPCAVIYFVDPKRRPEVLCQRDAHARFYRYDRKYKRERNTLPP